MTGELLYCVTDSLRGGWRRVISDLRGHVTAAGPLTETEPELRAEAGECVEPGPDIGGVKSCLRQTETRRQSYQLGDAAGLSILLYC